MGGPRGVNQTANANPTVADKPCRGEPWLAHEIGCKIVGDSQNRPYISSFFGIFTDKSRCWRPLSQGCVYAPYATLGVYVVNKIEAIALT